MLLSIIIPVYNVEAYLAECLDSIFNQFIDGCEVIAVNDGSTDNSRQILAEYQMKYPEFIIVDQENRGLSGARNTGIDYSSGKYLYFLDSDDYLLPNAVVNIIYSIKAFDVEVIGFNAMANGEKIYIPSFNVSDNSKSGIEFFIDFYNNNGAYPNVNVPIYVYKKDFLDTHYLKFKEGVYHEDILFSLLVFYFARSVIAFNIGIFNYRQQREGSICTNIKLKNLTDRSNICRDLDVFFKSKIFSNKYFYALIFQQYLYNLELAVSNNFASEQNSFFSTTDKKIMKKGITNQYEFKLWALASIDFRLMYVYSHNKLNKYLRKFINITFTVIQQFSCKIKLYDCENY